jgi:hypothetical protein
MYFVIMYFCQHCKMYFSPLSVCKHVYSLYFILFTCTMLLFFFCFLYLIICYQEQEGRVRRGDPINWFNPQSPTSYVLVFFVFSEFNAIYITRTKEYISLHRSMGNIYRVLTHKYFRCMVIITMMIKINNSIIAKRFYSIIM